MGKIRLSSNILQPDIMNRFGIKYSEGCLKKMCEEMQKKIDNNEFAFGELKHENTKSLNLEDIDVSHLVEKVYYKENIGPIVDVKLTKEYLEKNKDKLAIIPRAKISFKIEEEKNIDQMNIISFDLTRKID